MVEEGEGERERVANSLVLLPLLYTFLDAMDCCTVDVSEAHASPNSYGYWGRCWNMR